MVRYAVPVRGGVCQMIVVVDAMRLFDGLPGPLHEPYETSRASKTNHRAWYVTRSLCVATFAK
jgi:hypothetical protein